MQYLGRTRSLTAIRAIGPLGIGAGEKAFLREGGKQESRVAGTNETIFFKSTRTDMELGFHCDIVVELRHRAAKPEED